MIMEHTIAAITQSDSLQDDDVSLILTKMLDMFHGCIFFIDQIIENLENKAVCTQNLIF